MHVKSSDSIQLSKLICNSSPESIITEVRKIFCFHYSKRNFDNISENYYIIKTLFDGKFPGYKACNTEYHDFTHTVDILLATARLIDGYNLENKPFPVLLASSLLNAALFHDTGYIQENKDIQGTGAKHTATHVKRSIQFIEKHHEIFKISSDQILLMKNFILCTDLQIKTDAITFSSNEEKLSGYILGTSDILSQMSDRDYLEKLLLLFYEFQEAEIKGFDIEFDILQKTLSFHKLMKKRFSKTFFNVYKYAQRHFKERFMIDRNLYIEAIDRNIEYIKVIVKDGSVDFQDKLRRKAFATKTF